MTDFCSSIVNYFQQHEKINIVEKNTNVRAVFGAAANVPLIPIEATIVQILSPPILWNWDVVATGQIPLSQFFFAI